MTTAPRAASLHAGSPYRPEIDGLRAIAVMAVILYHARCTVVPAGPLGVDVFFVISGYLITGRIAGDLAVGRFSILAFYERRIRRIVPALSVMLILCAPIAWWVMLPHDLDSFGRSLVATSLSANNILGMLAAGYFGADKQYSPLIHTWSLGVEEQYYVFIPLLMAAAFRWHGRRGAVIGLVAVGAVSLAFSLAISRRWPDADFYLILSRAWELAAGGVAAWRRWANARGAGACPSLRSLARRPRSA